MTRERGEFSWLTLAFKALAVGLMIGTPLLGVWIASSLAAFANRATWLPVAAGALLFPGLPLAWEGIAHLRERGKKVRRFLTFSDRLVLRTLGINLLFIAILLAAWPQRAFVALSARGDWMLDGHHGPTAERTRSALLTAAGSLEWLYNATRDNPYREDKKNDGPTPAPAPTLSANPFPVSSVVPVPVPVPGSSSSSSTPTPTPTGTGTPTPAPPSPALHWPLPPSLHPLVAAMPKDVETSIPSVAHYIRDHEPDPFLRVKALHDYVADRVAYDAPAYVARHVPHEDADAESVFRSHKGVCAGYAQLLAALGKESGDEIVYVVGDARSESAPMEGEGHAWNAAKIAGTWYLIDATWNAGHVEGSTFTKAYDTGYLFTPPDVFAIQHHPEDDRWQLLERPLPRTEFFRRPVLAPAFFAQGLRLTTPDRSQVSAAGALDLVIENPSGTWLLADYEPHAGGAHVKCTGDGHTTFHCAFPAPGTYDVRLFTNTKQFGTYAYAGAVQVNARP